MCIEALMRKNVKLDPRGAPAMYAPVSILACIGQSKCSNSDGSARAEDDSGAKCYQSIAYIDSVLSYCSSNLQHWTLRVGMNRAAMQQLAYAVTV